MKLQTYSDVPDTVLIELGVKIANIIKPTSI